MLFLIAIVEPEERLVRENNEAVFSFNGLLYLVSGGEYICPQLSTDTWVYDGDPTFGDDWYAVDFSDPLDLGRNMVSDLRTLASMLRQEWLRIFQVV